ncbi:MAG TPA: hypothetical protein PL166_04935 [Candidatus Contendobacter sp.]|nr:hypothetical protein [Candidatus Contendobacter sp.]HRD48935.1 hypothetical protein [Candidatus Contendobacter sp.]
MVLKFDNAISDTIKIIEDRFNGHPPETTLVRDSFGVLTVVLPDDALKEANAWDNLAEQLHQGLGI